MAWYESWKRGPHICYLVLVDDLFLFVEASQEQMALALDCLNKFSEAEGEWINSKKTKVYFSKNVHKDIQQQILNLCNFKEV